MTKFKELPTEIWEEIHSVLDVYSALQFEAVNKTFNKFVSAKDKAKRKYEWYYQHIYRVPLESLKMKRLLSFMESPDVKFFVLNTAGDERNMEFNTLEEVTDYVFNDYINLLYELADDGVIECEVEDFNCSKCDNSAIQKSDLCFDHAIEKTKESLTFKANFIYDHYQEIGLGGNHCSEADFDGELLFGAEDVVFVEYLLGLNSGEAFEVYLGRKKENEEPKLKKKRRMKK
jgi:hypothetical protein